MAVNQLPGQLPEKIVNPELEQQIFQEVSQRLSNWAQSGQIVEKDQNYVVDLQIQEGKITLNGHPLNVMPGMPPLLIK